jgi:Tol biopolymer transport system component
MAQSFDPSALRLSGEPVPIAEDVATNSGLGRTGFTVSDSGILAYRSGVSAAKTAQVSWYDRTGKKLESITKPGDDRTIRLSPDEKKLALSRREGPTQANGDIWILDLLRGALPTRFTSDPEDEVSPVWSPDGSEIVYQDSKGKFYRKATNGAGNPEVLLNSDGARVWDWSRDGRFIAYDQGTNTARDLWVLPLSGDRKPVSFLRTKFVGIFPRFSPDGRWISYNSNEGGKQDVYVRPFPASDRQVRISAGGGIDAQWRLDGKELFYIAPDGKVMAVDVKSGSDFQAGLPKPLFDTKIFGLGTIFGAYAVSHDGQRFLINETTETANPSPIIILTNWTATLKR